MERLAFDTSSIAEFEKQPQLAAFVELKKPYDSVQHPLLWALLQGKGVHGKLLAAVQSLYDGGNPRQVVFKCTNHGKSLPLPGTLPAEAHSQGVAEAFQA